MDGVTGGYPDRREDEQPGIAPVDAGGVAVDQVAPVVEPTVQPTAPVEQPEQPGDTTDAVTGAPANATTVSGPTAGEPRKYGLFHAMGVPVKPDGRGSPVPRSAVDDYIQQAQEKARRDRADELRHQALMGAIRRAIKSGDAQAINDANEIIRTFNLDPATLAPHSPALGKMLAEQQQSLKNYDNDQKNAKLSTLEKLGTGIERGYQEIKSGFAVNSLRINEERKKSSTDFFEMVKGKIARGEALHPEQLRQWERRHGFYEELQQSDGVAFKELLESQAELARLPKSTAMRQLGEAKTVGDFLGILVSKPGEISAVMLSQAAPTLVAGVAGSLLLGPVGGVLAAGAVAFGSEFPQAMVRAFEKRGVNLQDPAAVRAILGKSEKMQEIYHDALIEAGIATAAEIATGTIGKRTLTAVRGGIKNEAAELRAQMIAQGTVGAAKEGITGLAIDGKLEGDKLVQGAVSGALGPVIDKAASGLGSAAKAGVRRIDGVVDPYYQAYQASRNPSSVPVDYNRSTASFKKAADDAERQSDALIRSIREEHDLRGRHGDKDDGTRRLESSFLGPQNLYMSWAAANRLRQAGILTDELSEKLGISRKWLDTENAKDLAEIKTVTLLTSSLKGEQVETFSREVRTAPNAMSAHEAAGYKAERQSRLESLSAQFEGAGDTPPDGWAAYRFIMNTERMPGGDPERAKLKAAEFAEYYRHLAIARGRGETADSVFLSEYPRLRP